jgi:hypothetical protein
MMRHAAPGSCSWLVRGSFRSVADVEHGDFDWDEAKAAANEKKHGIAFVEAATVFEDVDYLVNAMPNVEDDDLEVPELSTEWFQLALQPNRRGLRRGAKRAVFIDEEIAKRFGNDEELEQALRALLEASDH